MALELTSQELVFFLFLFLKCLASYGQAILGLTTLTQSSSKATEPSKSILLLQCLRMQNLLKSLQTLFLASLQALSASLTAGVRLFIASGSLSLSQSTRSDALPGGWINPKLCAIASREKL